MDGLSNRPSAGVRLKSDCRLEYREGKGADQDKGEEATRGKDKGRDTPDDDYSL